MDIQELRSSGIYNISESINYFFAEDRKVRELITENFSYQFANIINSMLEDRRGYYIRRFPDRETEDEYTGTVTMYASMAIMLENGQYAHVGECFKNLPVDVSNLSYADTRMKYRVSRSKSFPTFLSFEWEIWEFQKMRFDGFDYWRREA